MRKIEYVVVNEAKIEETIDAKRVLNSKVLSKTGFIVGNVKELRIRDFKIEGVLAYVKNTGYVFFGEDYIERVSNDAVILNIEPSVLIKGKKVITNDGAVIGRVKEVIRKGDKNDVQKIMVHQLWKKDIEVPINAIRVISKAVILNESYDVKQRYIWQKS